MSVPRIAARRLALLLLLPACRSWQPVALAQNIGYQGSKVRVERRVPSTDSLVVSADGLARKSHAPVVFEPAWVDGDSLFGYRSGSAQPVAIAVTDVRRAEERRFSGWRTGLLFVGVVVGGFAGLIGLVLAA
jgi:hypothetical protein